MISRRALLATGIAAAALPARASTASASRTFRIIRDGSDIGSHVLTARRQDDVFEMEIVIRIAVRFLGITAYRYELDNRERWQGGQLVSLDSRVNDDGTQDFARATRLDGQLTIEGSAYSGPAPAGIATTSYYLTDFLQRSPWVSTQTGRLLDVQIAPEGRDGWFDVSGGLSTKLGYDSRGEWVGCEFDAGGEQARYEVSAKTGTIGAVWAAG